MTDDDGATDSDAQSVTVSASEGISLSVIGYKVGGLPEGRPFVERCDLYQRRHLRNGALITTTANDRFHTDNINARGGGVTPIKVCEAGTTTCSGEVTITF